MSTKDDYPLLRLWYRRSGSHSFYVDQRLAEARKDGAPTDAVYKQDADGVWVTASDIYADPVRRDLGLPPLVVTLDNVIALAENFKGRKYFTYDPLCDRMGGPTVYVRMPTIVEAVNLAQFLRGKVDQVDLAEVLHRLGDEVTLAIRLLSQGKD